MDLATHFRVIAQNWLRILVISLVLAAVVFLASSLRSDVYQATETLSIRAGQTGGQTEQEAATFAAQVYAKYVETASFLSAVVRDSKLKLSLSQAGSRISASPVGDLGYLDVKATGPNRKDAETLTPRRGGPARRDDPCHRRQEDQRHRQPVARPPGEPPAAAGQPPVVGERRGGLTRRADQHSCSSRRRRRSRPRSTTRRSSAVRSPPRTPSPPSPSGMPCSASSSRSWW